MSTKVVPSAHVCAANCPIHSARPIASNAQIQAARQRAQEIRRLLILTTGAEPPGYSDHMDPRVRDYVDSLPSSLTSSESGYRPPKKPFWRRVLTGFWAWYTVRQP